MPAEPHRAIRSRSRGSPPMAPRRVELAGGSDARATSCGSRRVSASASSSLTAQTTAKRRARGRRGRAGDVAARATWRGATRVAVTARGHRCLARRHAGSGLPPTSCSAARVAGRALLRRRGQAAGASTSTRAGAARVAARWRTLWTVRPLASVMCSPRFRLTPIR